ncbi:MAG: hypothetical protein QW370_06775 [Ignisphaera sp.]
MRSLIARLVVVMLVFPLVNGFMNAICANGSSLGSRNIILIYNISGYAMPVKDINTFEPMTIDMVFYGISTNMSMYRSDIDSVLRKVGANISLDVNGVRVYYNCSELAGKKPVTYRLGPDKWIKISVPVGPCVVRGIPLVMKYRGKVVVEQINSTAFKVYANVIFEEAINKTKISEYLSFRNLSIIYPQEFSALASGGVEANLSYMIVNRVAVSGNDVIGFSPLYIAYPRNAEEVKEVYDKGLSITLYGVLLEFKMEKYFRTVLGKAIDESYVTAYVRNNRFITLVSQMSNFWMQNYYIMYNSPVYKGENIIYNYIDFVFDVITGKNVSQHIVYHPSQLYFISGRIIYNNIDFVYNVDGRMLNYKWVYPTLLQGVFLKFNFGSSGERWVVLFGNVTYGKDVDLDSIDIGYFSPSTGPSIRIDQLLVFAAIVATLMIIAMHYFAVRKRWH